MWDAAGRVQRTRCGEASLNWEGGRRSCWVERRPPLAIERPILRRRMLGVGPSLSLLPFLTCRAYGNPGHPEQQQLHHTHSDQDIEGLCIHRGRSSPQAVHLPEFYALELVTRDASPGDRLQTRRHKDAVDSINQPLLSRRSTGSIPPRAVDGPPHHPICLPRPIYIGCEPLAPKVAFIISAGIQRSI